MLEEILAHKRREVAARREKTSAVSFSAQIAALPPTRNLCAAIQAAPGIAVIAEIKRKSPSRGTLNESLDPGLMARTYQRAGANAVSVLTDEEYFGGSLADLRVVRQTVAIPVLRKDFIIEEWQLLESRVAGADAVLLIVAALSDQELRFLYTSALDLGLQALVEVHTEVEARAAVDIGAGLIGINNRDLRTFEVSLEVTSRIAPLLPKQVTIVSESGIGTARDLEFVRQAGVHAVLVGQSLVTSANPEAKLREFNRGPKMTFVKICGITNLADARVAAEAGADAIGLVFAPSPRQLTAADALEIRRIVPSSLAVFGVFVSEPAEEIAQISRTCALDFCQVHGPITEAHRRLLGLQLIPAIAVDGVDPYETVRAHQSSAVLLDARHSTRTTLESDPFDWKLATRTASQFKIILAGGLTPDNVTTALDIVRPYAVDVSGGVELRPGKKDNDKVFAFIQRIRTWDCQTDEGISASSAGGLFLKR